MHIDMLSFRSLDVKGGFYQKDFSFRVLPADLRRQVKVTKKGRGLVTLFFPVKSGLVPSQKGPRLDGVSGHKTSDSGLSYLCKNLNMLY